MLPVSSVPPDLRPQAKPVPVKRPPQAAARPAAQPRPVDPYANPQHYIQQAVARLGQPLTDAQIQANAQGQLSPLVQALTDSINRQAQAGTSAIGGYTSELAKALGGYQQNAANIYSGAQQSQAASDAALSQRLSGGGAQQAQDLGARLASINAPGAVNAAVGDATQTATGSGNALYATGSASLANLIASGAAEQSYASKLPGIAGLSGAQQIGGLQSKLAGQLADQTGQLQAKVPEIVSGLQGQRSDLLKSREALRGDLASFFDTRQAKQDALKQERDALGLPDPSLSRVRGFVVDKNGNPVGGSVQPIAGYHTTPGGGVAKDKAPPKAPAKPTVNTTLSAANHYLTDNSGNPILKAGKKQPYKGGATGSAPSATTRRKALADADLYFWGKHPVLNKDGTEKTPGIPGIPYGSAVKKIMVGYGLSKEDATAIANTLYTKPGERGRPFASKQAAFKAKTSKPPQVGATVKQKDGTYVYNGRDWVRK